MDIASNKNRFVTRRYQVAAGLHLMRYVSAADGRRPPAVLVTPKPDESDGVELVFSPLAPHAMLAAIGECVVIRAARAGAVLVTTMAAPAATSDDVELRIDRLDRPDASVGTSGTAAPSRATPPALVDTYRGIFQVSGHVQRRGDCTADAEGWLGAAGGPDRIEAFGIAWTRSVPGLRLQYGCEVEGGARHVAKLPGQLVGTRGQALGITRLDLALAGKRADDFELVVAASFAGAAPRTVAGRQVSLSGPRGLERLTGLSVSLREALAVPVAAPVAPSQRPATPQARSSAPALPAPQGRSVQSSSVQSSSVQAAPAQAAAAPAAKPAAPAAASPPPERPRIRVFRASRASA